MTSPTIFSFIISSQQQHKRLDVFLTENITTLSRNAVHRLLQEGYITLNKAPCNHRAYQVKEGDIITLTIPKVQPSSMQPFDAPLDIVYEDQDILILNKPAGLTVHPGAAHYQDTLANMLLAHCGDSLSGIGGEQRPGIVHRLDKDTTGLMVVAKHDQSHRNLSQQLTKRTLNRRYHALCWGVFTPPSGTLTGAIGRSPRHRKKMAVVKQGGKEAITHYTTLEVFGNHAASLIECRLATGRTHQIRVHAAHYSHALVGDPTYGSAQNKKIKPLPIDIQEEIKNFNRQALHSYYIGLEHPRNHTYIEFTCAFPDDFLALLDAFKHLNH